MLNVSVMVLRIESLFKRLFIDHKKFPYFSGHRKKHLMS